MRIIPILKKWQTIFEIQDGGVRHLVISENMHFLCNSGVLCQKPTPCLKKIRISRHTVRSSHQLTFGLLNVQSANNKIDDIIDMKKEHGLNVMLLNETWHDADSVSIRRLRAEGLQVINALV